MTRQLKEKKFKKYIKRERSDLAFVTIKLLFCERRWNINALKNEIGKILKEFEQNVKRWKEYLDVLGHTSHTQDT